MLAILVKVAHFMNNKEMRINTGYTFMNYVKSLEIYTGFEATHTYYVVLIFYLVFTTQTRNSKQLQQKQI